MKNCPSIEQWLLYAEKEIPSEQLDWYEKHRRSCDKCCRKIQFLNGIKTFLQQEGSGVQPTSPCLNEIELVELLDTGYREGENPQQWQHLATCTHCLQELFALSQLAKELPGVERELHREAVGRQSGLKQFFS